MTEYSRIHCDALDKEVNWPECENCCIKRRYHVLNIRECPFYGEFIVRFVKLQMRDLKRLKKYADKKGGNPVSHYIREAVAEYLDNHV